MSKYIFINIFKTKKLYIPLFFIFALIMFTLICAFSIYESVSATQEKQYGNYAAAAIVTKNMYEGNRVLIDENFIESYADAEYVTDYYAFKENNAGSEFLNMVSSKTTDSYGARPWADRFNGEMPFDLIAYSDISKSTHFRIGDREIKEGRFAGNTNECNISEELATLNNLSVGDSLEIYLNFYDKEYYTFEIVGIFENGTEEITSELALLSYKITGYSAIENSGIEEIEGRMAGEMSTASRVNITGNQILTAAPSSEDLAALHFMNLSLGYDTVAYYASNEQSIIEYADKISESLPEQFVVLDSADMMRTIRYIIDKTESSFISLFAIVSVIGGLFGALIIFYALKDRTYDIGVFRVLGMPRIKVTALIVSEILVISVAAAAAAWGLYFIVFAQIADFVYKTQGNALITDSILSDIKRTSYDTSIVIAARDSEFIANANILTLIGSFTAIAVLTLLTGVFAVLFIVRHEPMKTMREH